MRPSKYLKQLRHKANERHLKKLRTLADEASRLAWPESDQKISYVAIECLNTWANFSRAYFLSCTLLPWREKGSRITCNISIRTFNDAIDAAMRKCKRRVWDREVQKRGNWGRRDEPTWHDRNILIKSCEEIGCSNQTEILNAFSIQPKVFDHLPTFRNFYAHRNDDTAMKAKRVARSYSIPTPGHPSKILLTPAYGRPQILILDWIDDIHTIVELLCE
jgi:hypothetical protein